MRLLLGFALLLALNPAIAGEEWRLLWITHGPGHTWERTEAHGFLKRTGNILEGILMDEPEGRPDFRIRVQLRGNRATGVFTVISEKDGSSNLSGSYKRWEHSGQGGKQCPEQIQLVNDSEYIGLWRNACEP